MNPRISGYCPIKRLVLTRCGLFAKGTISLFESLLGNIYVEELFVSGNKATDEAIPSISQFLIEAKLKTLCLGDNNLSREGIEPLCHVLKSQKTIRVLHINGNNIGDEGANELILALRDGGVIEELNLSDCGLRSCQWAHRLPIMCSLAVLNVSRNDIADDGFVEFCDGLQNCFSIRHLDLSKNKFGGLWCVTAHAKWRL